MGTPCHIGFYEGDYMELKEFDACIRIHSDGNPEEVLPELLPIAKRFDTQRGLDNVENAAAWILYELMEADVKRYIKYRQDYPGIAGNIPTDGKTFLRYGVCVQVYDDIRFFYRIHPGQVLIYKTFNDDMSTWELIQTINLDDVPMPEIKEPEPVRIVITIEGGLVNDVFSDYPVSVLKIDYDVEGADLDDITTFELIPDGGTLEAFASFFDADVHAEMVDRYVNAITTEFNKAQAEAERSTKSNE